MAVISTQTTVNKLALQPLLNVKMGVNGFKPRNSGHTHEDEVASTSPEIDNNGGSLYNFESFAIVCRYKPQDQIEREQNEDDGLGAVTNSEAHIMQECSFYSEYNDDDWLFEDEPQYDQETYDYYGTTSDHYIQMVENGDIIDENGMCKMNAAELGASLSEEEMDLIDEERDQSFSDLEDKFERDEYGSDTLEIQNTEALAASEADPETVSAAPPAIESNVPISSAFAKASSPEPEAESLEPAAALEPAKIAPVPVAANNASYQMTA